jgi:hypothetical protein
VAVKLALPVAGDNAKNADVSVGHERIARGSESGIATATTAGGASGRSRCATRRNPMVCAALRIK